MRKVHATYDLYDWFNNLPLVIQFNKRDLSDIISKDQVLERWRPTGLPITFSSALHGKGIKETFEIALEQTYLRLNSEYRLKEKHSVTVKNFLEVIPG